MDHQISFTFGTPEHGWLPVDFHYRDFNLNFDASDVLNDPVDELFNALTQLKDNESRRITWWLEPGAYFFDFKKNGPDISLSIIETWDLHDETARQAQLIDFVVHEAAVFEPLRIALKEFYAQSYEEKHWPYRPDQNKIATL